MVGLAIGMLASLVIMQVFATFESQKRATTGASDAMTNGNIALFKVGHDVQSAGYSLIPLSKSKGSPLLCTLPLYVDPVVVPLVKGLFPVTIIDNYLGSGSDAITVRYGDTVRGGTSTPIQGVAGPIITVESNFGCEIGNVTLVMKAAGNVCAVSRVRAMSAPPPPPVPPAVLPPETLTLNDPTDTESGGTLACLGGWHEVTYTVDLVKYNLQRQDLGNLAASSVEPAVAGIVNIQAQYGISAAPSSNDVVQWVDAVDGQANGNFGATMSRDERNRIKAIHIAIVTRDAKMEPSNVTGVCTTAQGTVNNGPCAWDDTGLAGAAPVINLNAIVPNWKQYRYRVFETVMPIRNVVFSQPILTP